MSRICPIYGTAIYLDCLECDSRECLKTSKKYSQICIGVDQSYNNTGISIAADGVLVKVKSVWLGNCKNNFEKRDKIRKVLDQVVLNCTAKSKNVVCILERIRLQSKGFINIDYIKSIGALNSVIVDTCKKCDVDVYSVDTRCWKSQVIGTSKPKSNKYGVPDEKWPTVQWVISKGFADSVLMDMTDTRKTKGTFIEGGRRYMYNNDAADSAGIAMFWFVGDHGKLKEER